MASPGQTARLVRSSSAERLREQQDVLRCANVDLIKRIRGARMVTDDANDPSVPPPQLVRNRSYHFKTYDNVFTGSELVTWLVASGELAQAGGGAAGGGACACSATATAAALPANASAADAMRARADAVELAQRVLFDNGMCHHVCDEHEFEDAFLPVPQLTQPW